MIEQDVATEMTLYPVAYMSWKPRKNCYHGVMEIKPLINTQIEINKQWTALAIMLRNNAIPKLVYNRNKFPDGWNPDATSIGVTGDVIADLSEDMSAEQKARKTYDNILRLCDDPDVTDVIRFLREREVVHYQRFGERCVWRRKRWIRRTSI